MRQLSVLALVLAASRLAAQAPDFAFSFDQGSWAPHPAWTGQETAASHSYEGTGELGRFRAEGDGGTMVWARHFDPGLDIRGLRYLTIRYRAHDIDPELFSYFLYLTDATDGRMLAAYLALAASDLVLDGRWHTLTTTLKITERLTSAAIRFRAMPGQQGEVEISRLTLTAERPKTPLAEQVPWREGTDAAAGTPLPLRVQAATELAALQQALSCDDWFGGEQVLVAGVPFTVPLGGKVAASTTVAAKADLTIPVGRAAPELELLLGAELSPRILGYDGWQPGDCVTQPERFAVELVYADGSRERQMPWCVDQQSHAVWRGLHVYAVATEGKPIRELTLCDGMVTSAFHLVAVTAGAKPLAPAFDETVVHPAAGRASTAMAPTVRVEGNQVTAANATGRLRLALGGVPQIAAVQGELGLPWRLNAVATPLFEVRAERRGDPADDLTFDPPRSGPTWVEQEGHSASLQLGLRWRLEATSTEFELRLALRNLAAEPRGLPVVFPQLRVGLDGPREALRYAIPQSLLILGNEDRLYRASYGDDFPTQWLDLADAAGGGVYLATRTQDPRHRWYEAGKRGGLAEARVDWYENHPLPPGEWVDLPPAAIGLHGGDWHAAFDAYRRWRATWSRPLKPRLDWFDDLWHLRTHWVRTLGEGRPQQNEVNWLDPATMHLRSTEFLQKDLDLYGYIDYIHLFDWRISDQYGRWGDYDHYDEIGGLDEFKRAIQAVQDRGVRVGLYLDTYLVSRKSLIGRAHGEEWAAFNEAGKPRDGYSIAEDPMLNMCVAAPGWQDYLARTCARVVRETGCDGIYVDEGGMDLSQYWCWRPDHGHPVPATTIEGLRALFEEVKAALPDNVALYTEYCPPDALIPYLDGAYMACLRRSDPDRSPGFLNLSRFAFPDFKVFPIANAGSMYDGIYEGLKYSLFNGAALYSLAWGHDEGAYVYCRRIAKVLTDHRAAFRSLEPEPLVPTELAGVSANRFEGGGQTVWTVWNSRHRTVRGVVLRVPHVDGATYREVWSDAPVELRRDGDEDLLQIEIGPRDIAVMTAAGG